MGIVDRVDEVDRVDGVEKNIKDFGGLGTRMMFNLYSWLSLRGLAV